jgi:hypothetical protein
MDRMDYKSDYVYTKHKYYRKYKKLSIQVSLAGLSFVVLTHLNNTVTSFNEVHFDSKEIKMRICFRMPLEIIRS